MSDEAQWIRLTPLDAWFFRDGTPYTHRSGQDDTSDDQSGVVSQFPPSPFTVIGSVRAAVARQNGWSGKEDWDDNLIEKLGDGPDDLGPLSFQGPFLGKGEELLLPLPYHILGAFEENEKGTPCFVPSTVLSPGSKAVSTDCGEIRLPEIISSGNAEKKKLKAAETAFVTATGMGEILRGKLPSSDEVFLPRQLWDYEARVALERHATTHAVEEEALYSPSLVRMKPGICLVTGISGLSLDWELPAVFPIGGESRQAGAESLKALEFPKASEPLSDGIMLVAVTPVPLALENGIAKHPGSGMDFFEISKLKLVSACTGKPIFHGGWDSRVSKPIPLRPYLPPGSVFFCEGKLPEGAANEIFLGNRKAHGLGHCLVGHWPKRNFNTVSP